MTRRRRTTKPTGPQAVAACLPDELRSFDGWYYPNGLSDYMRELSRFLDEPTRLQPVMSAAGLSVAGWFRQMRNGDSRHSKGGTTEAMPPSEVERLRGISWRRPQQEVRR